MRSCCAFYFCDHLLMTCFIFSACSIHAVEVYRMLGETTRGSIPYSIYLTKWVTHDPSTGVRATTVLSFPQPSPLLGKTDGLNRSHDFSRQISFLSVLCSIMGMCSFGCCIEGDGEGGKRGTGGENPEGEGGLQPGCPPFPGLSPQDIGKTVLRVPSTQTIRKRKKENCHQR